MAGATCAANRAGHRRPIPPPTPGSPPRVASIRSSAGPPGRSWCGTAPDAGDGAAHLLAGAGVGRSRQGERRMRLFRGPERRDGAHRGGVPRRGRRVDAASGLLLDGGRGPGFADTVRDPRDFARQFSLRAGRRLGCCRQPPRRPTGCAVSAMSPGTRATTTRHRRSRSGRPVAERGSIPAVARSRGGQPAARPRPRRGSATRRPAYARRMIRRAQG